MENNEKRTLENVSDTTLEAPQVITVDVNPVNKLHAYLQKWGIAKKKRAFTLKPIYLGTLVKISKILLSIDIKLPGDQENNKAGKLLDANYHAITEHSESMATIIALAIQNDKRPVSKRLVQFILNNFSSKEVLAVLSLVLHQMDLTSFMSSIISVRGLNVLESQIAAPVIAASSEEVSQ